MDLYKYRSFIYVIKTKKEVEIYFLNFHLDDHYLTFTIPQIQWVCDALRQWSCRAHRPRKAGRPPFPVGSCGLKYRYDGELPALPSLLSQ